MATNPYEGKSIQEQIELLETQEPGSIRHEQLKMVITTENSKQLSNALIQLRASFDKNTSANESLATKVFWLNVVLTVATVLASLIALLEFIDKLSHPT
jgi:hypothetical protein